MIGVLPDDGSIEFIENFDWLQPVIGPSTNVFGSRANYPAIYKAEQALFIPRLEPQVQYQERTWLEADDPPEWEEGSSAYSLVPFGWVPLYSQTGTSPNKQNVQRRWRICWDLGTTPPLRRGWGFIHLRWRLADFYGLDVDVASPDFVQPEQFEKWWQLGIDDLPLAYDPNDIGTWHPDDYDHDDPLTWPGTEWVDNVEDMPNSDDNGGGLVTTYLLPRWPQVWNILDGGFQGTIPGGKLPGEEYFHPKFNGKSL